MSYRRNFWGLQRKSASRKKSKMLKRKGGRGRLRRLVRETLKRSSGLGNSAYMKRLSRWTRARSIRTWIGSLTIRLRGLRTDRLASWQTWESRRWTSTWKATKGGSTTTKPSSETWCNRSCCQTSKEADYRRKCSFSKEGSSRQQRNHCTRLSLKLLPSLWNRRKSDCSIFSFFSA